MCIYVVSRKREEVLKFNFRRQGGLANQTWHLVALMAAALKDPFLCAMTSTICQKSHVDWALSGRRYRRFSGRVFYTLLIYSYNSGS